MADKKQSVCDKYFILENGDEVRQAQPGIVRAEFRFTDGETLTVEKEQLPVDIREASMWHGISQKVGDAYAGKSGEEAEEAAGTIIERLCVGEWVKAREAGATRPSLVIDAVIAALEEAGQTVDDERRAGIAEKVKGADGRKAALSDARINVHYLRLQEERRRTRAAKLADEAATTDEGALDTF